MCIPPTPDEIDDLLASVAASEYSSEAVDIVEDWIEKRFGVVGRTTMEDRGVAVPSETPGQLTLEQLTDYPWTNVGMFVDQMHR